MRESKAQIIEGVENVVKSKIVANNTVEYERQDGTKVIRLHHTDILEQKPDGRLIFNSGGWKTPTTKDRMNNFQSSATIVQDKGLWYLSRGYDKDSRIPFFDGITLKNGKVINARKLAHSKEERLLKLINEYCKKLRKMETLPVPSNGDCWYCLMQTEDGQSLGEAFNDTDHLKSHLKEKYIHGSLIFNALKAHGYAEPGFIFQMDMRTSIVNAVRRYFKTNLGLAT